MLRIIIITLELLLLQVIGRWEEACSHSLAFQGADSPFHGPLRTKYNSQSKPAGPLLQCHRGKAAFCILNLGLK